MRSGSCVARTHTLAVVGHFKKKKNMTQRKNQEDRKVKPLQMLPFFGIFVETDKK